jgi:class 3 adenylate cyclase
MKPGDSVNLGARLESLTRLYNNHIIISEFTYEKVKNTLK